VTYNVNEKQILNKIHDLEYQDISFDLPHHPTKYYKTRKVSKINRIVIHTTDWVTTPQRLAEYDISPNHISKTGCPEITYHDIIMPNHQIIHTLPYTKVSWHVGVWNPGSIAIAMMYRVSNDKGVDVYAPTTEMLQSTYAHAGNACLNFGFSPDAVIGHRELKNTGWFMFKGSRKLRKTCPGIHMNLSNMRTQIAIHMQLVMQRDNVYKGEIDGLFGKQSRSAMKSWRTNYGLE